MKEYVLLFRMDILSKKAQPSPAQLKTYMQDWMEWMNAIAEKGQLASGGNHLSYTVARVLKPGHVKSEGPYVANNESVAGYIIVRAKNLEGAIFLAEKCPILKGENTSVEVRETATPPAMKEGAS